MTETRGRGPGVIVPPPFFFVAGFLVGWFVDARFVHLWPALGDSMGTPIDFIGGLMIGTGLGLAAWGMVTFRRHRTSIVPLHDASTLVIAGPYRFTRNPMYTGMSIIYVGAALVMGIGWPLLVLPIVLALLVRFVIAREERYLISAFGDQYRAYQKRVGRWG